MDSTPLHGNAPPLGSTGGSKLGQGNQGGHAGPIKAPLEVLCDRRQLEDAYVATHGAPKPRLEFQGSDGYLKKQWRMIGKGELGYIPAKHIVSALPEEAFIHPQEDHGGRLGQDEEEVRSHPTSRLHLTFRTTLLMCTAALPQFGNLRVTKEELDDWYAWFYGEDIAGRKPPPSDTTCCLQSAMHGARFTRWCTRAPLSPKPSRTSGATSSSGNGRSMSTSTGR